MSQDFTERAAHAVDRYGYFLNILRSQAEVVFRRGGIGMDAGREEAVQVAFGAARSYLSAEQAQLNDDTQTVAVRAYKQALSDLGLPDASIEDRFADFIFSGAQYVSRMLAAQAERDVMTMAQHIRTTVQRIDLYVRTGRHTRSTAAAQVTLEDARMPEFQFIDRAGRRYKGTKHVRDTYRQHLLNTYNEVYMDVVADHGHETVNVDHPDPDYRWLGETLAIVTGGTSTVDLPLYYDVRHEIFHPSSRATVTILNLGD